MGFTRYWNVTGKDFDNEFLHDVTRTCKLAEGKYGIHLGNGLGEDKPIINPVLVTLNGLGKEGHESFYICPSTPGSAFTKTARKPYDIVVAVVLRLAEEKGIVKDVESDDHPEMEMEPQKIELLYRLVKNG